MVLKYEELEKKLYDMIISGKGIMPDGQFLSERQISDAFGVSRTTARKAIDSLCKQGHLVQFHGKGTFIKGFLRTQPLDSITRCSQNYAEMGMTPKNQILCQEIIPANELAACRLKISKGDPVLLLKKLFKADRLIFNESISYIPTQPFPGIEHVNFEDTPILEIFRARFQAYAKKTEHTIEAVIPSEEIAANLRVTPDTPVLLFESVSYGMKDGRCIPMEYFETYYRTDFIRFSFVQEHEGYN